MTLIYESLNFTISAPNPPHVDRLDGGHIRIDPKTTVEDRTKLSPELAKELMMLTMVVGEAMATVLSRRGIDIGRINYQDNGNWRPEFHIHLYGRAKSAKRQPYGEALAFPPRATANDAFADLQALNIEDIAEIRGEIERLLATEPYKNF